MSFVWTKWSFQFKTLKIRSASITFTSLLSNSCLSISDNRALPGLMNIFNELMVQSLPSFGGFTPQVPQTAG